MQQQHWSNNSACCCLSDAVIVQGPCAAVGSRQQQRYLNPFIVTTDREQVPSAPAPAWAWFTELSEINKRHPTWDMNKDYATRRGESRWGGLVQMLRSWHFALLAFLTFLGSRLLYNSTIGSASLRPLFNRILLWSRQYRKTFESWGKWTENVSN